MEYLISFLGGLSCKIYDDLFDNKLFKNDIFEESLKGTQWIILTLMSYNDFNFTACFYLINLLNAMPNWNAWDIGYEKSLLILYPVFLLLSFSTRQSLTLFDLLYVLTFCVGMGIEPLLIKEEYSIRKLIVRSFLSISMFAWILIGHYFNVSWSFLKVAIYGLGYIITSSIFQLYMLNRDDEILSN